MTEYVVDFARSAARELERLPASAARRALTAIRGLRQDPRPRGSRKLVGSEATFRLRVGSYRVVYEVDDDRHRVLITRVRHRKDVYE